MSKAPYRKKQKCLRMAALVGGLLLNYICAGAQVGMLVVAGVLLVLGAVSVVLIKEK